jgi:site-specific DNA-methyltransferase (adenine-specific)
LKLKPLIAEKAKDRQRKGGKEKVVHNCAQAPKTRDELATIAGVSHGTIDKVETILDEATEKDLGELRRGEASINAVYKAIYKEVKRTKKAKAKATVPKDLPSVTERYTIHHGELATVGAKIADVSTDWIITDPPYPKEFLPVFDTLGAFAARTLKPGGSLLCMVGQSYLPDILRALEKHLTYQWTLAYLTPGGQAVQLWDRNVNTFWKPVLWFSRGKYKGDWVGDVCRSDVNDNDKEHHHWGQSESGMADIIERFTYPGQVICDPFGGAMTTGVVAVRMNRLFIGIDIDSEAIRTGLDRLSKLSKTGDGKSTTPH